MSKVKIEKRKPITIAYIEHIGPYGNVPFDKYIDRLYGWAKLRKVRPGFYPMAVYHDDPENTPPEKCRTEVAIPVGGEPQGDGEVSVRRIPAMTVATISHKGTTDEYKEVYRLLARWTDDNGYDWDGPPMEVYTRKPKTVDGKVVVSAKIMAPVRKR